MEIEEGLLGKIHSLKNCIIFSIDIPAVVHWSDNILSLENNTFLQSNKSYYIGQNIIFCHG